MPDKKRLRAELRARQDKEVKANQTALRASITETERLVGESEKMIARHRRERGDDDDEDGDA